MQTLTQLPQGSIAFFIDLDQITSHTPEEIETQVRSRGYSPQRRTTTYRYNGKPREETVLLLHEGRSPVDPKVEADWEYFATTLQPSHAVHLRTGI